MPEPRNYKDWREKLTELEGGASGHGYAATWTLADGQVLEVVGRPHGNGAFALIFKDITSEIGLTRQFRAELDLNQAVLDSLEEALVIFDSNGVLTISNAAYATMWGRRSWDLFARHYLARSDATMECANGGDASLAAA